MRIKFLTEPAILLEPDKILVIADIHLGIEYEIFRAGVKIPSQTEKIQDKIDSLIKQTKAKQLIILGDIKHNIPITSWQETQEIPKFLEHLSKKIKVTIVKGNHDGDIDTLLGKAKVKIVEPSGFRIKNIGFVHGQAWFDKDLLECEHLLIAHIHPVVEFFSHGSRITEHCWLHCDVDNEIIEKKFKRKSKIKNAVVMPVFNHLIGGCAVNSKDFEPIGPLLQNNAINWKEAGIYLLDGTYLGKLDKIKK